MTPVLVQAEEINEIEVSDETDEAGIDEVEDASESENVKSVLNTSLARTSSAKTASITVNGDDNVYTLNSDANNIIKKIDPDWSDFKKILYVHDWLLKNVTYDYDTYNGITDNPNAYEACGAIHDGLAVCAGYSRAFKYILDKLDIKCKIVSSTNLDHAWNMVKLNNKWYYVDCTWDDKYEQGWENEPNFLYYRNFLKSRDTLHKSHGTEDWTIGFVGGENVYEDTSIAAEDYVCDEIDLNSYTLTGLASDTLCDDYTDDDYNADEYAYDKTLYSSYDVTNGNENYEIVSNVGNIEINNSDSIRIKALWFNPETGKLQEEYYHSDVITKKILGFTGYENGVLSYVYGLCYPEIGTDRYVNPYHPVESSIDISKYISTYKVSFNANGGSPVPASKTVAYGDAITFGENPVKDHYSFGGWYDNPEFTGKRYYNGSRLTITKDCTFYAKWIEDLHYFEVSFNANGGSPVPASKTVAYGDTITFGENPVKDHYSFGGWYDNAEFTGKSYYNGSRLTIEKDYTFYAKWDEDSDEDSDEDLQYCTVSFNANGGSPIPASKTVAYGDTFTFPKDPEKAHYSFLGWNEDATDVNAGRYHYGNKIEIKNDTTFYAMWAADFDNTLTFDSNGGSAVETQYLKSNEKPVKPADPTRDGYTFKGWYVDSNLINRYHRGWEHGYIGIPSVCDKTGKANNNFWTNRLVEDMELHAEWEKNADETPSEEAPSEEQPSEEAPSEETPSEETHEKETVDPTLKTVNLSNGAGLTYKAEMTYTRDKSSIVSNANVKLTFAENDENAGKIYVKKVTAKKPKKNATSTTIKVTLKGTDKASKKLAKQMNKQLKKLSITLKSAE